MKNIRKIIVFVIIILLIAYFCNSESSEKNSPNFSERELLEMKIEELEEDNEKLKDENSSLSSELDNLSRDYEYSQDLIQLLQDQLESYGIEPYEL